jgi:adenylyl-sulfate kinase
VTGGEKRETDGQPECDAARKEFEIMSCGNEQKGVTLWFTGLPCSGKSAVADVVAARLKALGLRAERLDGDIVRQDLTRDLGFSKEDRDENIRRVTFVAKLLTRNGVAVLTSFISPYKEMRDRARREIGSFMEIYVKCPVEVCIKRDVKGMYQKALRGEIKEFTGVSDPYEEPERPELVLETDKETLEESAGRVLDRARELGYV